MSRWNKIPTTTYAHSTYAMMVFHTYKEHVTRTLYSSSHLYHHGLRSVIVGLKDSRKISQPADKAPSVGRPVHPIR